LLYIELSRYNRIRGEWCRVLEKELLRKVLISDANKAYNSASLINLIPTSVIPILCAVITRCVARNVIFDARQSTLSRTVDYEVATSVLNKINESDGF